MNEEYVVSRLMYCFAIPYDFAFSIYRHLENENLLEDFIVKMDTFEDYQDFHNRYYN